MMLTDHECYQGSVEMQETYKDVKLNERTNEFTSVVNLNAGTLAAAAIVDATRQSSSRKDCKSYLNFDGGTLKYQATSNPFSNSALPTRITVYGGGATIEFTKISSLSSLGSVRLLRPTGRGRRM